LTGLSASVDAAFSNEFCKRVTDFIELGFSTNNTDYYELAYIISFLIELNFALNYFLFYYSTVFVSSARVI
jgi:hypothetical protein